MKVNREENMTRDIIRQRVYTLMLMLVLCLSFPVASLAQGSGHGSGKVTLNLKNAQVSAFFNEMKRQTGLDFICPANVSNKIPSITVNVTNETVEKVLSDVLSKHGCTWNRKGKIISVSVANNKLTTGTVYDANGEPLIGVNISVKGLKKAGAVTDIDGKFSIHVPNHPHVLVFGYVGMKTKEVSLSTNRLNMNVTMESNTKQVDEVVVNGVFARKANSFTGSVRTINNDDLKRVGSGNVLQSLKNIESSVMFMDNMSLGSDPNAVPELTMRGKSSINLNETDLKATYGQDPNAPLFVLDGFEVSIQKIMDLDMDRVESLTILKDASAKAIYGSKAANGVIIIELKKNANGRLRVTYNGSLSIEAPDLTSYNLCNAAEKLEIEKLFGMYDNPEASYNNQRAMTQLYNQKLSAVVSGIDTDWKSKPLHLGTGTKHNVSVELGESALKAIVDLSYNSIQGVMKGSDRETISGGISLSYRHKKFLFKNQLTVTSNVANDSPYGSFSEYVALNPYYTPYDQYGKISQNIVPQLDLGNDVTVNSWYNNIKFEANPLYNAQLNTLLRKKYFDVTNNFDLQWFVFEGLKATARFGLTRRTDTNDTFYPANHLKFNSYTGEDLTRKGSYSLEQGTQSNLSGKLDIQYNKTFAKKHDLYFNGGFDISSREYSTNLQQAEGFPSDKMNDIIFARQYAKDTKPTGRESTTHEFGYYLSCNYSYDNRYNFDGTFRQSASSMYGANSRWGMFWSVGGSWNMHNEKWLKNSGITLLRLRATVGSTGSQSSAAYNALASYEYFLDTTYGGLLGAYLTGMRNEDLKWQEKLEENFGIDFSWKNRYNLTFEYYNSVTNNALNPLTLVPSTGFSTVQENVGKILNRGFDLRLSATVWQMPKERSYLSLSFMASHNKNTLKEISSAMKQYNEQQAKNATSTTKPLQKYYDGVSMDAIWAMKSLGIDPANGREIYLVRDEKTGEYRRTYAYDANQQVICGDALPKLSGNFGVSFQYKGFGMNVVLGYKWGAKMYNETLVNKVENANMSNNVDRRIYTDRWRKPGDIAKYKALSENVYISEESKFASPKTYPTSRFVQKRNELSISSVQLSYDFWKWKFVKRIGMERLMLRLTATDLYTFSTIEIERGTSYPFARTINASLSVTF